MRIIGGTARGKTLVAPEGLDTRPTSDRLREALFNILAPRVPGARVLDLFGGTGALAAEALSRGAAGAAVVDIAPQAVRAIRKNCDLKGVSGRADVYEGDWRAQLPRLRGPFDIVFLDPPYRMAEVYAEAFLALRAARLLAEGAVIVMEYAAGTRIPLPAEALVYDERRYGAAGVSLVRAREEDAGPSAQAAPSPRERARNADGEDADPRTQISPPAAGEGSGPSVQANPQAAGKEER